jgi:hypothetical protein
LFVDASDIADEAEGLVQEGAKVYITALASDPIDQVVHELNTIGQAVGGIAEGQA